MGGILCYIAYVGFDIFDTLDGSDHAVQRSYRLRCATVCKSVIGLNCFYVAGRIQCIRRRRYGKLMQPLEKIDWGDLDAYRDEVLANWIEPSGIRTCLVDKCWIITGEKGSGKSALCRAISERYASDYFALRLVNFDKVTFKAIYENLRALTSSTSTSSVISLANYWQYAIFVELLSECYKKSPNQYGDLWHRVPKLFRRSNAPSKTILLLIERAFDTLTRNLGATQDGGFGLPASSGLSATAISVLAQGAY